MPNKIYSLPRLPFGESKATAHTDARSFGEKVNQAFPGLNAYDPLNKETPFAAKTISLPLTTVTLVASTMMSSLVDRDGRQHLTLMLPLAGQCTVTVEGKRLEWGAGRAGILLPECDERIVGTGDNRTLVMLRLYPEVLKATARAMLGEPQSDLNLRLDRARTVAMTIHGRPLEPLLLQTGRILDLMGCETHLLQLQGYEDWFNRMAVAILCPELFNQDSGASRGSVKHRTDVVHRLCDEMLSDVGKKFTLTMLEQKSGYSARALQYAFKELFGCGPLEWLREQRLQIARQRILTEPDESVTEIGHQCGFSSLSQFSTAYKERFGVSPSKYSQLFQFI
jgi:AraC-like DNA-binding protein